MYTVLSNKTCFPTQILLNYLNLVIFFKNIPIFFFYVKIITFLTCLSINQNILMLNLKM